MKNVKTEEEIRVRECGCGWGGEGGGGGKVMRKKRGKEGETRKEKRDIRN